MRFKVVCSDIDGTLLNQDRQLSPKTIETIRDLPRHVPVVLASSRMPAAMRHLQEELGILHHPLICYNGSYILHFDEAGTQAEVLFSKVIEAGLCKQLVVLGEQHGIHVSLYRADEWYVPALDQWADREQNNTKVKPEVADLHGVVEVWENESSGAHKVMCMGDPEGIDQIVEALADSGLNMYRSKPTYLEIADGSMNKATALELLLQSKFDHSLADVIAFGDNYNDIELLTAAGIGVAVGNAKEEVKLIANDITDPGKEDGVATAIEKWRAGGLG